MKKIFILLLMVMNLSCVTYKYNEIMDGAKDLVELDDSLYFMSEGKLYRYYQEEGIWYIEEVPINKKGGWE